MKLTELEKDYINDLLNYEIIFLYQEKSENEQSINEVEQVRRDFAKGSIDKKQLEIILSYVYLEYQSVDDTDESKTELEFLESLIESLEKMNGENEQ